MIQEHRRLLFKTNSLDTLVLNDQKVEVVMDYKVFLKSNYICRRISELAGISNEICFIYGGSVQTEMSQTYQKTRIYIKDLYIPVKQKITGASFDAHGSATLLSSEYFLRKGLRNVGIGHSHASFDLFHSSIDYFNCKSMVNDIGIKIKPKIYKASRKLFCWAVKKLFAAPPTEPFAVMPSLVFNERGRYIDSMLAVQTGNNFALRNHPISLFNKNARLSKIEKREIDAKITEVLMYNNMQINRNYKAHTNTFCYT